MQGRQQKPIAQFGLDPSLIRGQTPIHDDSKSLGLPASREQQELTKSLLRNVLTKVGLTEGSSSSPDTGRFSCYADLNSYDGGGANGNVIENGESKNQPVTGFSSPSNPTDHCQPDLSKVDLKQEKENSKGNAFLVLKPLSSLLR